MKNFSGRINTDVRPHEAYIFNAERAVKIGDCFLRDGWNVEVDSEYIEDKITDTIADLMHLCDYVDMPFFDLLAKAKYHHTCEVEVEIEFFETGKFNWK